MKHSTRSKQCSKAGKIGCAVRWKDHEKEKTKIVRVYENDFDYIATYCANARIPFILGFRLLVRYIRRCEGYSAFLQQRKHDNV